MGRIMWEGNLRRGPAVLQGRALAGVRDRVIASGGGLPLGCSEWPVQPILSDPSERLSPMADAVVIIPTYNERENIGKIVRRVMALPESVDVLVVDDGSPDGTGQDVRKLQEEFPGRLFLEERRGKRGLGGAYLHGFAWALARDYDYVFEMDADFSHSPDDLIRLRRACDAGADVAVGSRYVRGGNIRNWRWDRIALSSLASLYVRGVLWFPVRDATAGFKCYRRRVLEKIDLKQIRFAGYAFQIEMKYAAHRHGFRLVEVPIVFVDRVEGVSKMSLKIFKEALWGVVQMKLRKW
jgi:dolichol-phosphate mannosyltransferase